jgi:hypothetical protein
MNKITEACKCCFVYNYSIWELSEVQIVFRIFSLFFCHFCFVVVYAKTIINLSVGE